MVSSYTNSFFSHNNIDSPCIATARAGNVIGGGDWSADRLIPDIFGAIYDQRELLIRFPKAVRPWQHVLEPLSGYMLLAENACLKKEKNIKGLGTLVLQK